MLNNLSLFNEATEILPTRIRDAVRAASTFFSGTIYEVRLYFDTATVLTTDTGTLYVTENGGLSADMRHSLIPTADEGELTLMKASGWSPFAHEKEIRNGFITFGSGIRVGFGGIGSSPSVKGVTSINIRIPYSPRVQNGENEIAELCLSVKNGLLIAGEPRSGKTTFLRRCASGLARNGKRVCVIDERCELFGRDGSGLPPPANADVISGCDKSDGIMRALRLMSPEYIICDELGTGKESDCVAACLNSGVKFIASIHAGDLAQLARRRQFLLLFGENVFDRVLFLDGAAPGKVKHIYGIAEVKNEICGTYDDMCADSFCGDKLYGGNKKTNNGLSALGGFPA